MPGIFGVINRSETNLPRELANRMQSRLEHGETWFKGVYQQHQFGFHGVVDFEPYLKRDYISSPNGISLVVYGNIYSVEELRIPSQTKAKILLSLYEKEDLKFLKSLNGSFVFSICDENKGKIIIGNDRYGSKNVFYAITASEILYSSEIKAILEGLSTNPELNVEALAEFFTFSFPLGNKTFFRGIYLIPPASVFIYDFMNSKIQVERYWDFQFNRCKKPKSLKAYLEEFCFLMKKAVEIRMDGDKVGILLSGGLDSRLLAAFAKKIAEKTDKELISFTFGTKGGWQEEIAEQVAHKLGIENRFYEIPPNFIANYAEEVVYKGDGHIRIRDAHFISMLDKVRREVDVVLAGFFCSELFGENVSEDIVKVSNKEQLIDYLFNTHRVDKVADYAPNIFSIKFPSERKIRENFIDTIKEIPTFDSYVDAAEYWMRRQRDWRYILFMSNYINWYLDCRLPYLDNDVVNFAINLPLELKIKKNFIHKALKYLFPELAKIPWEKSGAPPDTTGIALKFYKMKRFVEILPKYVMQKALFGKVFFTPKEYRAYDYWLRTGSRWYVEEVLLRGSSIFEHKYVKKIVNEHMSGKRNHDVLICDLLNITLLVRIFNLNTKCVGE